MKVLSGIRATGQQKLVTTADNGDVVEITLYFQSRTAVWKMDIESGDFILKGVRISRVLNMLCQHNNIISFGIGVIMNGEGEPFLINDFSTGRVQLAILTPSEVQAVGAFYVAVKDAG